MNLKHAIKIVNCLADINIAGQLSEEGQFPFNTHVETEGKYINLQNNCIHFKVGSYVYVCVYVSFHACICLAVCAFRFFLPLSKPKTIEMNPRDPKHNYELYLNDAKLQTG